MSWKSRRDQREDDDNVRKARNWYSHEKNVLLERQKIESDNVNVHVSDDQGLVHDRFGHSKGSRWNHRSKVGDDQSSTGSIKFPEINES